MSSTLRPATPRSPGADPAALSGRRGLSVAVVTCAVAAGLVLLAGGRVWVRFTIEQAPLPRLHGAATGHAVAAVVAPLAYVALAGVVAFPATRKVGRRLAGALVALAGVGVVVASAGVLASPHSAVGSAAVRLAGRNGVQPGGVTVDWWPWLAIAGGVLAVAAGALALLRSGDWPAMGRRYEAGARRPRPSRPSETSMWDRLDRGDDPTV